MTGGWKIGMRRCWTIGALKVKDGKRSIHSTYSIDIYIYKRRK